MAVWRNVDRFNHTDGAFILLETAESEKRRGTRPQLGLGLPIHHVLTWNSKESEKSSFDLAFLVGLKVQFIQRKRK